MQMNTIVKGAVGAMLFGGTLGMTGAADAGLTWTSVFSAMYVGLPGVYAYAGGATNSSGGSWLTQSAATSNGIRWSGSNVTGGAQLSSLINCSFTVSAPTSIVISGLAPASGVNQYDSYPYSGVSVQLIGPNSFLWQQDSSSASYSSGVLNLSAGSYTIQGSLFAAANSGYSGTLLDIAVVPAPGALALLGAAGAAGTRRRR